MKVIIDKKSAIRTTFGDDHIITVQTLRRKSEPEDKYVMKGCAVRYMGDLNEKQLNFLAEWCKRHMTEYLPFGQANLFDGLFHIKSHWKRPDENLDGTIDMVDEHSYYIQGFWDEENRNLSWN